MLKKIIKKFLIKLYFGNSFFRKGIKFGKGSFIREHSVVNGGKYMKIGYNTRIYPYSRIECFDNISNEKLYPKLTIGNNVIMGRNTSILCTNEINIGDDSMFASYSFISDENHGIDLSVKKRYECQKLTSKPVNIGKNCWIGEKVIILPGVNVGNNSIIGAGSVVTRSIPDNCIAVGNPARVIKKYNFSNNKWEKIDERKNE